jgi:hypothetical protein
MTTEWKYDNDKQVWIVTIEDGCIRHSCYMAHRRGKNWVATVTKDLRAPGGLERRFWRKGSGMYYVIPTGLSIGEYIEFGGDYYTASGRADRKREYYQIKEIGSQAIWLEPIEKKDVGKKPAEPDNQIKRFIDLGDSGEPLQEGKT